VQKWRCAVCGFIYDGDVPPEKCPNCGAPKEKFKRLSDDKAQLVERSRLTNGLHVRLIALLMKVSEIAQKGIDDNLDPRCFQIFTQAKEMADLVAQRSRTEIQTHVGKSKWG
jgi:predicted  nucleic acid-binding Zn-ribbon protein